jgi:glycosyltransferase involved in cell wall biosynthesis
MTILMVHNARIPTSNYNDAERVIWWLAKQLCKEGHNVRFLAKKGSTCPFATVLVLDEKKSIREQIPEDTDIVHFHFQPTEVLSDLAHVVTQHEDSADGEPQSANTIYISSHQAAKYGSTQFIPYGVDFSEYGTPNLTQKRLYFHLMGNAAQIGRNVKPALDFVLKANARLHVIGGNRVNFRQGLRVTLSPSARFHGVLLPDGRNAILNGSKGMLYPQPSLEVFPLSVVESLWFGCPVFGSPQGVMPELLGRASRSIRQNGGGSIDAFYSDFGLLTLKKAELQEAIQNADAYHAKDIHEFAAAHYGIENMSVSYLKAYEAILR